ncbi:unnamed protein product [Rotaria sp. Silwood2]|nr:unnamed protein product [Rotaria sp. Silwood2]CAF2521801.1 unnamed protein product [Rotaria sp. Silwood2]CAF2954566.1 unnamed protein product [Rotaria sp. Silwood2]CAF4089058.1 unnamed protein product [Rotaria sp. Silwood2]CAF4442007.1 unnamed protein product [Rotaria sp. Silwood2]
MIDLGKTIMDEQDWYEKDLSDFDDLQSSDEHTVIEEQLIHSTQNKSLKKPFIIENNYHGKDYPFDLWYLIAMYIAPEDIGRFALICRKTNQIVNSVPFWISVFRKYNKLEAKRLTRLLVREHLSIVRTYVIKSLYQTYPLFQERFDKTNVIQKEPHFLLSSRCIRIWYSKRPTQRDLYNYYFEFHFDNVQQSKQEDIQIQAISPIFQANNQSIIDKDSYILHLISSNLVLIGPYMGMVLSQITLNVSSDYRYHKLKMWFDSSRSCSQKSKYNNSVVIIDPILCLRIYKWYNSPANLD